MDGLLKVIDMLGNTVLNLERQLAEARQVIAHLQGQAQRQTDNGQEDPVITRAREHAVEVMTGRD